MGFPFTEMYLPKRRYDRWQEFKQVIYEPHFSFQDDLEADDWFEEVRANEELQRGLIRDHKPHDITNRFFEMLALRLRPKHNVVLVVIGAPGDGKTVLAAMLPLYGFGTAMLKGFAIITVLGVSIGVFITRPAFAKIVEILLKT
jgi:hypothetical protein